MHKQRTRKRATIIRLVIGALTLLVLTLGSCAGVFGPSDDDGEQQYSVTVSPDPVQGGEITGDDMNVTGAPGTEYRWTASPASSYRFVKWTFASGMADSTENPLVFSVSSQDETITAVFAFLTEVMITASDPSLGEGETSTITLTPDTPFESGAVLTPTFGGTAQKGTHYTVSGLDGDGNMEIAGGEPNKEFTINAAGDLSGLSADVEIEVGLDDSSGEYNAGTSITITLSAGGAYSVIYQAPNSTGGSVPTDSTTYSDGDTATLLGNTGSLVSTGYVFEGWWDSEDTDQSASREGSGLYQAGAQVTIGDADYTVYAQWRDPLFGYKPGTHDSGNIPASETAYSYQSTVTLADNSGNLELADHTFKGWNDAEDGTGTFYKAGDTFSMPGEDYYVYPDWEPHRFWEDVAVSKDGSYMAAVERTGSIWLSDDSGASWEENTAAGEALWERVDISDDGQIIVATKASGSGYNSGLAWSSDGGSTWNVEESATADYFQDASLFADGNGDADSGNTRIVAIRDGEVAVSDSTLGASLSWDSVDVNSDADHDAWQAVVGNDVDTSGTAGNQYLLVAITRGDGAATTPAKIYIGTYDEEASGNPVSASWDTAAVQESLDSGSTWSSTTPTFLSDVAISADGNHLAAASGSYGQPGGAVFVSTDFGQTWKKHYGLTEERWYSDITISDDGSTAFAVSNDDTTHGPGLWKTTDFTNAAGATWSRVDDDVTDDLFEVTDNTWSIAASSPDSGDIELLAARYGWLLFSSNDDGQSWKLGEFPE